MQYTDNEAALIGGLISNYFFQPSVDARLRESYRRVLRHLRENTLSASDLSRIQNALTFLSPLCRDTREAHKDMMGLTLKLMPCCEPADKRPPVASATGGLLSRVPASPIRRGFVLEWDGACLRF